MKEEILHALRDQQTAVQSELEELSRWLYLHPEPSWEEYRAADKLAGFLRERQFTVERGIAGLDTAFLAEYCGDPKGPIVGIMVEYDGLPDIGHGCGHNLIAAAGVGAAAMLAGGWPQLPGAVRVLGCPAEEGGGIRSPGGKVDLIRDGFFSELDVAMMIHPGHEDRVYMRTLALNAVNFTFKGRTAHASAAPHEGISALEAAILTYNNVNALRQYALPGVRIHGIINEGGRAANVIPEKSTMEFFARAPAGQEVRDATQRLIDCARAASLVTGAELEVEQYCEPLTDFINNDPLAKCMEENYRRVGRRLASSSGAAQGSTDMANVSYEVPSLHATIAMGSEADVGAIHSRSFADSTQTEAGRRALADAAYIMASTAARVMSDGDLRKRIRDAFNQD